MAPRKLTADPLDFRFHRALGGKDDTLKEGAALANTVVVAVVVAIAGAFVFRYRGLFTAAGTLKFYYLRPGGSRTANTTAECYDPAVAGPHVDVAVVAGTAFAIDITPAGESELLITFTPTGAGAVTYSDGMQQ